ncbi:hypothetical protein [Planctomicrobium sp. SH527]
MTKISGINVRSTISSIAFTLTQSKEVLWNARLTGSGPVLVFMLG